MKYEPISSRLNQLGNAQNPHQGDAIKALCVCSAGLLRSPTIAKYLTLKGYNTRACGTSQDYALVPLSTALLTWADEIHVVKEQAELVRFCLEDLGLDDVDVVVYDIPDMYGTFDPELEELIANNKSK
jgi:predicted protein tyrosine phosphatase